MTHKPDDMPLLPCPFCGHRAFINDEVKTAGDHMVFGCNTDGCAGFRALHAGDDIDAVDTATAAWNRRADRVPIEPGDLEKIKDEVVKYLEGNIADLKGIDEHEYAPVAMENAIRCAVNYLNNEGYLKAAPSDPLVDVLGEALKNVRGLISYLGEGEPNDQYDEMLGPKLPEMLKNVDAALAQYNARKGRTA